MTENAPSRILVVDDDDAVVQSVTALIELETSHMVVAETSSVRALQHAKVAPIDMVISDFLMPELDGIRLLLEIRGLYPESALILLTGYADKGMRFAPSTRPASSTTWRNRGTTTIS